MADPDHVSATRAAYEAAADSYGDLVGTDLSTATEAPLDRALLVAFVELVKQAKAGPVADLARP